VAILDECPQIEGLVGDSAGQQVAHLDAHQCLAAAGSRLGNLDVKAVIWRAIVLENIFRFTSITSI